MDCCKTDDGIKAGKKRIILVGEPNVGKSLLFNRLTGGYAVVSNYPGTTVGVEKGKLNLGGEVCNLIDSPGIYSFIPITDEERVTRGLILDSPSIIVQVADVKNLERSLCLTIDLASLGFPMVLAINMIDETRGMKIDFSAIERRLGIRAVGISALNNTGITELLKTIKASRKTTRSRFFFSKPLEKPIRKISSLLRSDYGVKKETIAYLLLQEDKEVVKIVSSKEKEFLSIEKKMHDIKNKRKEDFSYQAAIEKYAVAKATVKLSVKNTEKRKAAFSEKLDYLMTHPVLGLFFLSIVLFFGLYLFVGVFGAGILVNFIEKDIFAKYIDSILNHLINSYLPWSTLNDLFGNEYGIFTFGLKYAVAIILPIVATFFFAFSIIEDSGYLPRLAMLLDSFFKRIGLNGRAVIPMVLGFGCDTMATIVTRVQETRKEKIITTLLLALAVPCSAQLGVVFAILSGRPNVLLVWAAIVIAIFFLIGFLASKIVPGEKAFFYMDMPPLRVPKFSNIIIKTLSRLEWYFKEILPIFIFASVLIWLGKLTGAFWIVISFFTPLVFFMGLPAKTAEVFLFGFFRRDYGAAGLYSISSMLTGNQLLVASVTLTLFVPCIAQFSIMIKERGIKTAMLIVLFIFPFAFSVGIILNILLSLLGATL